MAISAFDLPQIWQKPAYQVLLHALKQLRIDPPVWNLDVSRDDILSEQEETAREHQQMAVYLSTIIKSRLCWIGSVDEREAIWDEASKRLAERCGRAAMGEVTRRWPFKGDDHRPFELILREPPFDGDNLGVKTWGSSFALAQMLHNIGSSSLAHLFPQEASAFRPSVLELGSGTGLLGLAASAIWQTRVILTDLPSMLPNLTHNVDINRAIVQARGGSVEARALTWGGAEHDIDPVLFSNKHEFKIIIIADPLYDDDHPHLLATTIDEHLKLDSEARVLVMVPKRDEFTVKLQASFVDEMAATRVPLCCLEQYVATGQDDFTDNEETNRTKCWLGIFGRQNMKSAS